MSISEDLASRIVAFRYQNLPEAAIRAAKAAILDTIGVTLAGAADTSTKIVEHVLGVGSGTGTSLVFGSHRRTTSLDAALINGTAAHALDFDDCSDTMGGHPSAPVLPALLALAEEVDASGRDVLTAYIAGIETEIRIARGVNFHHYDKGWHPTATLGIFGAAAACARLLGLVEERVATALSLSVSLASGVKANFGTMTKPLHVGHCARNGLLGALLAHHGFTANLDAFEHKQGFLNVFNGAGTFDIARIFDHWADPLEIVTPGLAIKQYPCCASTHPAIDAMIEISSIDRFDPERASKIDVRIHARRLAHTNRPNPHSALEAKFSLQYCLARALMHGKVVLEHFEGMAFRDQQVRRLMKHIEAAPFDLSNPLTAEVVVTLSGGESHASKLRAARAESSAHAISPELLRAKFENCAGKVLSPAQISHLQDLIQRLEQLSSVRKLTDAIAANLSAQNPIT
jgi:2-methylcitrate dehydratase PrpD